MIQAVYGIKEFQTKLPQIARDISKLGGHYLVTNRSKPSLVAMPFSDYQEIADILLEMNSPSLKKDVAAGRREYRQGKTRYFKEFVKNSHEQISDSDYH